MEGLVIGFTSVGYQELIMYLIGFALIFLAIKKEYEPMLLLPIGFGAILANLPLSVVLEYEGTAGFLRFFSTAG
jgi:oxaloacetate decarboxylase beta subunit